VYWTEAYCTKCIMIQNLLNMIMILHNNDLIDANKHLV